MTHFTAPPVKVVQSPIIVKGQYLRRYIDRNICLKGNTMDNVQNSFNEIFQTATITADGGNATSAQLANLFDNDTQVDHGYDGYYAAY
jgi:hypothetical protein